MEQTWRIYSPEKRNTKYDTKIALRNMVRSPLRSRDISQVSIDWYNDDVYKMQIKGEEVKVIAREHGQKNHTAEVFEEQEEGIFFLVSDENFREAESGLVKIFG